MLQFLALDAEVLCSNVIRVLHDSFVNLSAAVHYLESIGLNIELRRDPLQHRWHIHIDRLALVYFAIDIE